MARAWWLAVGPLVAVVLLAGAEPDLRSVLALTLAAVAVALMATEPSRTLGTATARVAVARLQTTVAPRHCDPDAAGRPRPRAPANL